MSLTEFDIIDRYFTDIGAHNDGVRLGVGDDCALLQVEDGQQIAVTVDNLVMDRHFDSAVAAADVAFKSVSVSVSDLAAMGAVPLWMTLSLTLAEADKNWLKAFSKGLDEALDLYQVALVGGNIAQGPTNIGTQLIGSVTPGQAITRSDAKPGDLIFVSGEFGAEALGLNLHLHRFHAEDLTPQVEQQLLHAWYRPLAQPRLGWRLRGLASSCIDISDGLLGDLQHILKSSDVGARLQLRDVPLHPYINAMISNKKDSLQAIFENYVCAGEGYQLCFTVAPAKKDRVIQLGKQENIALSCIGVIEPQHGLRVYYENSLLNLNSSAYRHF